MSANHNYCVILAGGIGRRLWPSSRRAKPKQFIDFFSTGRTLLQQTYDRFARFIPQDHIYVSTYKDYVDLVSEQLPELPTDNILAEPVQLSTAPAAAWASCHIGNSDPEACIVASPADHHIINEERFIADIEKGLGFVATHQEFLAMGVRPAVPNTAYGYIQMGENGVGAGLYRVKSFSEKPAAEYARLFTESGEFLWNTGLFLWHVDTLIKRISSVGNGRPVGRPDRPLTNAEELEIIKKRYPTSLHRTLDLMVLESCDNAYVQVCGFGWADVGCWPEIYAVADKDADGNALLTHSKVMFSGCRNNLVRLPDGMGAAIKGLDGYLIAQDGNLLVICPNEDPALVRRLLNEAQMQLGEDYI